MQETKQAIEKDGHTWVVAKEYGADGKIERTSALRVDLACRVARVWADSEAEQAKTEAK